MLILCKILRPCKLASKQYTLEGVEEKWNNMASQKCILIGLLIFFTAFILIGICILAALLTLTNSDPNQTRGDGATSEITTISTLKSSIQVTEKTTILMATLKSSTQVTSTSDDIKSSTTSFTTQANPNTTSVESLTKSDISTIKPNDTKGTTDPTFYNGTVITTTILDTQSTDITTSAMISSKGIETGISYTAQDYMYIV